MARHDKYAKHKQFLTWVAAGVAVTAVVGVSQYILGGVSVATVALSIVSVNPASATVAVTNSTSAAVPVFVAAVVVDETTGETVDSLSGSSAPSLGSIQPGETVQSTFAWPTPLESGDYSIDMTPVASSGLPVGATVSETVSF